MQVVKSYIDLDLIDEMNVEESRPGLSREVDTRVTTVVGSFGVGMHLITCPQESALENPNFEVSAKLPRLFVQLTPDAVGTIMRLKIGGGSGARISSSSSADESRWEIGRRPCGTNCCCTSCYRKVCC